MGQRCELVWCMCVAQVIYFNTWIHSVVVMEASKHATAKYLRLHVCLWATTLSFSLSLSARVQLGGFCLR
jgi:hypothetical protein